MTLKNKLAIVLFSVSLFSAGAAHAAEPLVGLLLGGAAGSLVGRDIGGHQGAVVGGLIGAAVGVAIANDMSDRNYDRGYAPSAPYRPSAMVTPVYGGQDYRHSAYRSRHGWNGSGYHHYGR